jgi:aldose 1-epimerase
VPERTRTAAPSGRQLEIRHGAQRAVVTEVGATLRVYEDGQEDLLDGFDEGEMCDGGRGQPLIPWPNRLEDGRYEFAGRRGQAALDEPERRNAIHGLVRWLPWETAVHEPARVVMSLVLHPQPAYPFELGLTLAYSLSGGGLAVEVTATNLGEGPLPFGAGFHPYLSVGTATVDDIVLRLPARSRWALDERGLPTHKEPVGGTALDFSEARRVGALGMDAAFTDLARGVDGRVRAELAAPGGGRGLTLWADRPFTHLMCFTGDTLADPARRRRGLAVEPMTCPPNALRTGEGVVALAPGESFSASWGIAPA